MLVKLSASRHTGWKLTLMAALYGTAVTAAIAQEPDSTVYQCEFANGRKAFQDRPCAAGARQTHARLSNGFLLKNNARAMRVAAAATAPPPTALTEEQVVLLEIERNAVMARMNNEIDALVATPTLDDGARQQRINLVRATGMSQIQALETTVAQARALLPPPKESGAVKAAAMPEVAGAPAAIPPLDAPNLSLTTTTADPAQSAQLSSN